MASKISTEEERSQSSKIGYRPSTERLQTELIKKGGKTVDEVHKMDRQTLVSAVVDLRHADTLPLPEASQTMATPGVDLTQLIQLMVLEIQRERQETLEKQKEKDRG